MAAAESKIVKIIGDQNIPFLQTPAGMMLVSDPSISPAEGTTTADGNAGGTTLIDNTRTEATNHWIGQLILITSGVNIGQVREITIWDLPSFTFTVAPAFEAQVVAAVTYKVLSNFATPRSPFKIGTVSSMAATVAIPITVIGAGVETDILNLGGNGLEPTIQIDRPLGMTLVDALTYVFNINRYYKNCYFHLTGLNANCTVKVYVTNNAEHPLGNYTIDTGNLGVNTEVWINAPGKLQANIRITVTCAIGFNTLASTLYSITTDVGFKNWNYNLGPAPNFGYLPRIAKVFYKFIAGVDAVSAIGFWEKDRQVGSIPVDVVGTFGNAIGMIGQNFLGVNPDVYTTFATTNYFSVVAPVGALFEILELAVVLPDVIDKDTYRSL